MTPPAAKPIGSERIPSGYASIWELFVDWCTVAGVVALPAEPGLVVAFLADCPCAPATRRRRVAAIDHHHHTTAGFTRPGQSPVLAALGRPFGQPDSPSVDTMATVEAALRGLPSHGWTQGMFGRRDRCLLVLSQVAGIPYRHLATLTAGDITVTAGTATIATKALTWTLRPADDGLVCGPFAVTRWLRVLDVVMTKPSNRVLAKQIADADPVTDRSPHLCMSTRELSSLIVDVVDRPPG